MVSAVSSPGGERSNAARGRARRLAGQSWKLLPILLVFVVVGPVVGTIAFGLVMASVASSLAEVSRISATMLIGLVWGFSHVIGGIPAAIAGLIVGIKQVYLGGAGWRFALGVGLVVGCVPLLMIAADGWANDRRVADLKDIAQIVAGACCVTTLPTLACWWIIRSWFVDRPGANEVAA